MIIKTRILRHFVITYKRGENPRIIHKFFIQSHHKHDAIRTFIKHVPDVKILCVHIINNGVTK